jgi:hypothetical protein
MTVHKSQGATCDTVFVVGPAGLYREAAYVALSRARHGATLYATSTEIAEPAERDHARGLPLPGDNETFEHRLLAALRRSQSKTFATTVDPTAGRIAELAHFDLTVLHDRLRHAVAAERRACTLGLSDPADQLAESERTRHTRAHLRVDGRVRALDRDNVGTVTALHDTCGTATVVFVAADGTQTARTLAWGVLQPIDRRNPVDVTPAAQAWLDHDAARVDHAARRWAAELHRAGVSPGDAADVGRAIETRRLALARQLHGDQPDWLDCWLGPRPADPAGATVWDDTIAHLADWRDLHHIDPAEPGVGPRPHEPHLQHEWLDAMATTLTQRRWLTTRNPHTEPTPTRTLAPGEIQRRIDQLETLFAQAPPDQRRIIDDLTTGRLTTPDLHTALAHAHEAQAGRDQWIVANWPYIVEHHELRRLTPDPLGRWPQPLRPAVRDLLHRLAERIDPTTPVEPRTLAQLQTELTRLDPGRRLRQLTEHLVAARDHLTHVQDRLEAELDRHRRDPLVAERDVLLAEQTASRAAVEAEREALRNRRWQPNEANELRAAINRRTATIYQHAVTEHPEWVVQLLTELDDRGSLQQLRPNQVHQLIVDAATQRDMGPAPTLPTVVPFRPAEALHR